jgi:hypothetical protein
MLPPGMARIRRRCTGVAMRGTAASKFQSYGGAVKLSLHHVGSVGGLS